MTDKRIFQFKLVIIFAAILPLFACSSVKNGIYGLGLSYEYSRAGLDAKTIDMDGKSISLLESKRDPAKSTIILIHGLTVNKENWVRFSRYLTDSYHVVAIDLPGHGASFKDLNMRYDIDDQVRYLNEIIGKMNINQFHMAGNSMGGAISSLYAATYPEQVQSLLLIDSAGIYDYKCELNQIFDQGINPFIVTSTDEFDRLLNLAMEDKSNLPPWPFIGIMADKAVENKTINEKLCSDFLPDSFGGGEHKYDFKEELKKITAPTLILWGKKDRILSIDNASIFEELIPHTRKVVFEEIGHMPMLEVPEESAQVYLDFLSSI